MKNIGKQFQGSVSLSRRILIIALIALTLMPVAVTAFAAVSTSPGKNILTTGSVNVRDLPNLKGKSIGTISKGKTAPYLGENATDERGVMWYKITYNNGTGWVSSKYSEIENAGTTPPVDPPATTGKTVKATGSVHVRDKANLTGKILGTVSKGNTAPYLDENATDERGVVWYSVSFNGGTGWVSSKYSEVVTPKN